MLKLVEKYEDVVRNAREFHSNINNGLVEKLSFFRHWYYIEEIDSFAPSKFIGYKNITIEAYKEGTETRESYMDGRDTVKKLNQWFKLVEDQDFDVYHEKLEDLLSKFNKKINKKFYLHYKK